MRGPGYLRGGKTPRRTPKLRAAAEAPGAIVPPGAVLPRPKRKRGAPEALFQIQAVAYLRLVLPEPCRVWFVPNRHIPGLPAWVAAQLQRMGLLAGVHDVHIMVPGNNCAALYTVECKAGRGTTTTEQDDFGRAVVQCGGMWHEARTLERVAELVRAIAERHNLTLRPVRIGPAGVFRGPQ